MKLSAAEVRAWQSKGAVFPGLEGKRVKLRAWYYRPLAEDTTVWYGPYESRDGMSKAAETYLKKLP